MHKFSRESLKELKLQIRLCVIPTNSCLIAMHYNMTVNDYNVDISEMKWYLTSGASNVQEQEEIL